MLLCHPPARPRLSPESEQSSTAPGLMSRGRKPRSSSQVTQGVSAAYRTLCQLAVVQLQDFFLHSQ